MSRVNKLTKTAVCYHNFNNVWQVLFHLAVNLFCIQTTPECCDVIWSAAISVDLVFCPTVNLARLVHDRVNPL